MSTEYKELEEIYMRIVESHAGIVVERIKSLLSINDENPDSQLYKDLLKYKEDIENGLETLKNHYLPLDNKG